MLTFQGVSEIIKQVAIMRGDLEDDEAALGHAAAAEAEAQRLLDQAKEQGLASWAARKTSGTVPCTLIASRASPACCSR